jgi:hypothetical protein
MLKASRRCARVLRFHRPAQKSADPEITQEHAANEAEPNPHVHQGARNRSEPKRGHKSIGRISRRRSQPGGQSNPPPFGERPPNAQDADGTDRRSDGKTDSNAFE